MMVRFPAATFRPAEAVTVLVGLGSNQGDRLRELRRAVQALDLHPEIEVTAWSSIYETTYVGPGRQDDYLNACLEVATALAPGVLLAVLKGIESRHGRMPGGHMKPRPIDLDLLFYGDNTLSGNDLTIPHPRIRDRAFVLEPLAEVAPAWVFPDSGETIGEACAKIRRKSGAGVRLQAGLSLAPAVIPGDGLTKEEWRAALAVYCR